MHEALTQLRAALASLAAIDVPSLPAACLVEGYEALAEAEARLDAEQSRWLRAVEVQDAAADERGRATRGWLTEDVRLAGAEAAKRLRVARRLAQVPATEAEWRAGGITVDHVDVIASAVLDVRPDLREALEGILLEAARSMCPSDVRKLVDEVRVRLGVDESTDEAYARRHATRGIGLDVTFGGWGSLSGTLSPDVAETLATALRAAGARCGPEDDRTPRQRMHDALGTIAAHYLATAGVSDHNGERPRLVVTIPFDVLNEQRDDWARLDSRVPLSPSVARRLACDAQVLPVVLGGAGQVLDLGRATETWNTAQRRAAWIRDGGCCGRPGCRQRPVELHHMVWWSRGGPTDLENGVWLCAFHHWLAHEGGWTVRREADGGYTWTDPVGRRHSEAA